jgi:putative transposase
LFFKPPLKPKKHPQRYKNIPRIRKPKDYQVSNPGDLVEVDVKHLPNLGERRYGFVAIDVVSKQACVYVGSSITAKQGAIAWKRAVHQLGLPKAVLCDNGSENLGAFAALVKEQQIPLYFARPRTPKDKPHVERFIGTLERECLQWGGVALDRNDQQKIIDVWLHKYHDYRPHQSLNYLTPNEFKAKLESEEVALII